MDFLLNPQRWHSTCSVSVKQTNFGATMNLNDSPLGMLELSDESGESIALRYPGLARVKLLLERGNDELFDSEEFSVDDFAF